MYSKYKKILACLGLALISLNAHSAFIDTDTYCANYGCVITSDNNTSNIYDVYNFSNPAAPITAGQQLVFYTANPIAGAGTVDPLFTNTNTNISTTMPANQGNRIRIINGLGVATPLDTVDNGNGLLDAGDTFTKFGIQSSTRIDYFPIGATGTLGANPQSHSFYISSRNVNFDVRALANLSASSGEFPTLVTAGTIGFALNYTKTGTNGGTVFGTNTNGALGFTNVAGLNLSNLSTNTTVASFTTDIYAAANAGANIQTKSVRMEATYTLPAFSLSQGRGEMQWAVGFTFWRR